MITEDYVSFEIAKLLKEKGFNSAETLMFYNSEGKCFTNQFYYNFDKNDIIDCPTLQMAMKWLREVHNIIITVRLFNSAEHFYLGEPNQFTVDIATTTMSSQKGHIRAVYSTYEEAAESAIKYVLENLI